MMPTWIGSSHNDRRYAFHRQISAICRSLEFGAPSPEVAVSLKSGWPVVIQ